MEDQKIKSVAAQTEVPVSSVSPTSNKKTFPKVDKKIIFGIIAVLIVAVLVSALLRLS